MSASARDPGGAFRRMFGGRLTPVVTWLILVELGAFIVYAFASGPAAWREHLALLPGRAIRHFELWQIVTAMWFHVAGMALLGNLIGLFVIGPLLERPWGGRRFLIFFLATGLVGNLVAALLGAAFGFRQVLGGCGPSVVAMMVAFGFVYRRQQLLFFGVAPMRGLHLSVFFTGLWLLLALLAADATAITAYVAAGLLGAYLANDRVPLGRVLDRVTRFWEKARLRRLRRRYKVIPGGRDEREKFLN